MKRLYQILTFAILLGLSSCCDFVCERHKYAESMIEKIEKYRIVNGRLPEDVTEIGLVETDESPAYYSKTSDSTYTVWYAIGFESNVYQSQTKEWKEEGWN